MSWRLAYALGSLQKQLNTTYPNRSKLSDGTIGDAAHILVKSEHNPNPAGVVTAMDITHDPTNGADMNQLAALLIADPRTWYVIFNGRIWEAGKWVKYYGSNPHDKHLHISMKQDPANYDNASKWNLKEEPMFNEGDRKNVISYLGEEDNGQFKEVVGKPWKEAMYGIFESGLFKINQTINPGDVPIINQVFARDDGAKQVGKPWKRFFYDYTAKHGPTSAERKLVRILEIAKE